MKYFFRLVPWSTLSEPKSSCHSTMTFLLLDVTLLGDHSMRDSNFKYYFLLRQRELMSVPKKIVLASVCGLAKVAKAKVQ